MALHSTIHTRIYATNRSFCETFECPPFYLLYLMPHKPTHSSIQVFHTHTHTHTHRSVGSNAAALIHWRPPLIVCPPVIVPKRPQTHSLTHSLTHSQAPSHSGRVHIRTKKALAYIITDTHAHTHTLHHTTAHHTTHQSIESSWPTALITLMKRLWDAKPSQR